ncbi:MAG: hypothetical protein DI586_03180 [Micavibrio aeruginosavorus]|uniref:Bifunctional protein HldE n=1 Tax=Micavibrio aeruginosavorus TaxID=349221 RepID=A0A2W5FQ86_9BACT|nr:MAG: hypothetical protein DI586_03180 [Micavibrio aeruginosavorus]
MGFSSKDFRDIRVIVIGDIMLDRYVYGEVTRISPEGPFPILSVSRERNGLGGAGNVFANLKSLGVDARIIGVVGQDEGANTIRSLCGPGAEFIEAGDRPTIQKIRFVGNGAQMMRADHEIIAPLLEADEGKLIELVKTEIRFAKAVILSDYGKGMFSKKGLAEIIAEARSLGIPVLVDPKGKDYTIYNGANIVTPNRKELAEGSGAPSLSGDADIADAAVKLLAMSGIESIVATRSEDGMTVLDGIDGVPVHIKTMAQEVTDVSGAGDTVIATLAAGIAAGLSLVEAATLANKAAGIAVAKAGAHAVTAEELFSHTIGYESYATWDAAKEKITSWKEMGLKVGFTNGCFDILHAGHVTYLKEAASHCDRLVLGLNHDKSVRILKGETRPVNAEADRATVMAGLGSVDLVVLFGAEEADADNTPCDIIGYLQPDIIFKGGDYTEDQLPEAKVARSYGGDVKIMGVVEGRSTTNIIKKIYAA